MTIFDTYDDGDVRRGFHVWNPDEPLDGPFDDAECWLSAQDVPDWTAE